MRGRIIFSICVLLLGFVLPWWAILPFFFLGSYLYAPWCELAVVGLFFDLAFSIDRLYFHGFEFVYTAIAVISIAIISIIKKRLINV